MSAAMRWTQASCPLLRFIHRVTADILYAMPYALCSMLHAPCAKHTTCVLLEPAVQLQRIGIEIVLSQKIFIIINNRIVAQQHQRSEKRVEFIVVT